MEGITGSRPELEGQIAVGTHYEPSSKRLKVSPGNLDNKDYVNTKLIIQEKREGWGDLIEDDRAFGEKPLPLPDIGVKRDFIGRGGTKRKKRRRNNKKTKRNRRKIKRNRK